MYSAFGAVWLMSPSVVGGFRRPPPGLCDALLSQALLQLGFQTDSLVMLFQKIAEGFVRQLLKAAPTLLPKQVDGAPGRLIELHALTDHRFTGPCEAEWLVGTRRGTYLREKASREQRHQERPAGSEAAGLCHSDRERRWAGTCHRGQQDRQAQPKPLAEGPSAREGGNRGHEQKIATSFHYFKRKYPIGTNRVRS